MQMEVKSTNSFKKIKIKKGFHFKKKKKKKGLHMRGPWGDRATGPPRGCTSCGEITLSVMASKPGPQ